MKTFDGLAGWNSLIWFFTVVGLPITIPWLINHITDLVMFKQRKRALQGKVVLITGASSGLGEALAHAFYGCGCKLILVARRTQELQRVKDALMSKHQEVKTHTPTIHPLDLSEINSISAEVAKIFKYHGRIDILINNAGISYRGEIADTKIDVDTKLMLVNYFGQIALTKAVIPGMIKQNLGHIVCVSSIQGKIAIPLRSAYAASKHALQAWCDSARAELSTKNIEVTVVSPGYIHTALSLNALTGSGQKYGVMDETTKNGYSPDYIADKILHAIVKGQKEITIANFAQKIAILLRVVSPSLYFYVMQNRAQRFMKKK
ncbi:hypothetical protein QAD02_015381 [Eretmocerus hayati]|uniref:Uncharacterized protein n=1 Tax=Eretmocerus hayati TaxID=131215 RepID=A0ACC2PAK0_9HYME|nr:hypothetical protein QAD02_015381 [Eretmocerus hayati]